MVPTRTPLAGHASLKKYSTAKGKNEREPILTTADTFEPARVE